MFTEAIMTNSEASTKLNKYSETINDIKNRDTQLQKCIQSCYNSWRLEQTYRNGIELYRENKFSEAYKVFISLNNYKSSFKYCDELNRLLTDIDYEKAIQLFNSNDWIKAQKAFSVLGDYKESIKYYKTSIYMEAVNLYRSERYTDAFNKFLSLGDFEDSKNYISEICKAVPSFSYKIAKIGDIVDFGKYSWYVIDKRNNTLTLWATENVTEMCYGVYAQWDKSDARKWLNNDFYNEFKNEEKSMIIKTYCINTEIYDPKTRKTVKRDKGENTEDFIYILSLKELDTLKIQVPKDSQQWWERSFGAGFYVIVACWNEQAFKKNNEIVYFFGNNKIVYYSAHPDEIKKGIRPALTIRID